MKTTLLAIGKLRPAIREACDEYLARLRRYGEMVERQLREGPATGPPLVQRRQEGARLVEAIPAGSLVVALDRAGTAWSSEALAKAVGQWRDRGTPVTLIIGGSTGLDDQVLVRAEHRWSLGPLTLPHELARLVVLEQWYRAATILRGERYHK